ncbi:neutral/alkaline non-lysosomal ceramidase N-terminal domain-containing protein [Candidatus Sumerlaeota bacterium]|nr:neutral/alkaline non-lysosomal ceramidase N-terminal domain-containing protein [Candidatus Sumerlaeota bacterium]
MATILIIAALICVSGVAGAAQFKAGFARRDITPKESVPMWGYGGMGPRLSNGVLDPLMAAVVVIDTGDHKLALMGLDLGRGPRKSSMEKISKAVLEKSGVDLLMISGSHTHHGPVTELTDVEGRGKGRYDAAIAYVADFEQNLIDAINEAAANARDAKMGVGSARVPLNRNRHTKFQPKPVDDELNVLRFDDAATGKPIAFVASFAAHSTIIRAELRKFSAEWPGKMKKHVEEAMGAPCVFMQGAAGDMSPNTTEITGKLAAELKAKDPDAPTTPADVYEIDAFGHQMADEVVKIVQGIQTQVPAAPSLQGMDEDFEFTSRIDINDPAILKKYELAFFKELAANFTEELAGGKIRPHLTTILLNGDLALVGGSGEFFCNHSNRLKERSRVKTIFIGYCNGHHMYLPTIEAAAEGGYGGDALVSWVEIGAGERMMNKALINIYNMTTGFKTDVKLF